MEMSIWLLHGVLACGALSIVFPAGIVRFWTKSTSSSMSHWAIHSLGVLMLASAMTIGSLGSSHLSHKHQFLGLLVSGSALIQQVLGYASKANLQDRASRYLGIIHSALGFSILFIGWFAMFTGMQLGSVGATPTIIVGLLSGIEVAALVIGSVTIRRRQAHYAWLAGKTHNRSGPADEAFALGEYDSEDEREGMIENESGNSGRKSIHASSGSSE